MSQNRIVSERSVYETPWFHLIARNVAGVPEPFYSVKETDYVTVLAVTEAGQVPLVRQYRPAIDGWSLELPSGHVEAGETPEIAAAKELAEEAGLVAGHLHLLGVLASDTGRLSNKLWCYFAADARPLGPDFVEEDGLTISYVDAAARSIIRAPEFVSALNLAVVLLALDGGFLSAT